MIESETLNCWFYNHAYTFCKNKKRRRYKHKYNHTCIDTDSMTLVSRTKSQRHTLIYIQSTVVRRPPSNQKPISTHNSKHIYSQKTNAYTQRQILAISLFFLPVLSLSPHMHAAMHSQATITLNIYNHLCKHKHINTQKAMLNRWTCNHTNSQKFMLSSLSTDKYN